MVNKVTLIGNVGADPEVRALEGGVKVTRLNIATTERIFNRQTQETKEHTEWHSVTLWRGLADVADKYIRKGSQVYIEGSLRTRDWTDKDGNKRYTTEIVANEMKMLGRREGQGAGQTAGYGAGQTAGQGAAPQGASYTPNSQPQTMSREDIAASAPSEVDDLPF